jgi:hypothetical protein
LRVVEAKLEAVEPDSFRREQLQQSALHTLDRLERDDTLGRGRLVRNPDEHPACVMQATERVRGAGNRRDELGLERRTPAGQTRDPGRAH